MEELFPNTEDAAKEKHVPVVDQFNFSVMVSVGADAHPMIQAHYIEWIALQTESGLQFHFLKPGDPPCYEFQVQENERFVAAFAYCNLHGLWKA